MKDKIKISLIKKKWSQRELSRQMGISMSYLQDILNENRKPVERIKQMEKLLEIDLEEFT